MFSKSDPMDEVELIEKVRPGDIVVLRAKKPLKEDVLNAIAEHLDDIRKRVTPLEFIILDHNMELHQILRPDDEGETKMDTRHL